MNLYQRQKTEKRYLITLKTMDKAISNFIFEMFHLKQIRHE